MNKRNAWTGLMTAIALVCGAGAALVVPAHGQNNPGNEGGDNKRGYAAAGEPRPTQQLVVNGRPARPDVAPQMIRGRMMVPIRFVAQELGAQVAPVQRLPLGPDAVFVHAAGGVPGSLLVSGFPWHCSRRCWVLYCQNEA